VRTVETNLDEKIVGQRGGPQILARAKQITASALDLLTIQGHLVGDVTNPAYKNITAALVGDTLTVSFECNLALPVNYVVIQAKIKPYEGTISD
jgi:hypothetical protein